MVHSIPTQVDVLIVGAGPTGLTLANLLGSMGVSTLLVEMSPATSELPRAIVLDDEGTRTLQAIGLSEEAISQALIGEGSRYEAADGRTIAEVGRGSQEYGFSKRHFISQPKLEITLAKGLSRWHSVMPAFATTLLRFKNEPDGVEAVVSAEGNETHVRTQWLIACDGGRSTIRDTLEIPFKGSTYSQDWIVLDLATDSDQRASTRFICDPRRPTVIVPAPGGGKRYEFMLLPGETREEVLRPTFLAGLMSSYREYRAEDVVRAAVYTFHARVADVWRSGRVLLAGDAAHVTPPFAGQGMNAGLRDASNLAWKLALHTKGKAGPGLLDTYETERREPCLAMIQLAVLMGKIVMPASAEEARIQDALMHLISEAPELRQYLFEMRFKPRPEYAAGAFLRERDDVPGSLVGRMVPQPVVYNTHGQVRLDDLLGSGFCLFTQDRATFDSARALKHPLWRKLSPSVVLVGVEGKIASSDPAIAWPTDTSIAAPFKAHRDHVLVVRPDRYGAGAASLPDLQGFADRYEAIIEAEDNLNLPGNPEGPGF